MLDAELMTAELNGIEQNEREYATATERHVKRARKRERGSDRLAQRDCDKNGSRCVGRKNGTERRCATERNGTRNETDGQSTFSLSIYVSHLFRIHADIEIVRAFRLVHWVSLYLYKKVFVE